MKILEIFVFHELYSTQRTASLWENIGSLSNCLDLFSGKRVYVTHDGCSPIIAELGNFGVYSCQLMLSAEKSSSYSDLKCGFEEELPLKAGLLGYSH